MNGTAIGTIPPVLPHTIHLKATAAPGPPDFSPPIPKQLPSSSLVDAIH